MFIAAMVKRSSNCVKTGLFPRAFLSNSLMNDGTAVSLCRLVLQYGVDSLTRFKVAMQWV